MFPTREASLLTLTLMLVIASLGPVVGADESASAASRPDAMTQMNCGARIECITPDGQTNRVSKLAGADPSAAALIMEDDTVSCVLQEGETNFVVELPSARLLDRLTFLNENAMARGELKISVSNNRLKPDSAGWLEVEGVVPFSHKRLFGVSLIGIEARFVRLSFRVEKAGRIAAFATHAEVHPPAQTAEPLRDSFKTSALHEALDSPLASRQTRSQVLLTAAADSVGPITPFVR
jgi:hypothetical protein